MRKRDRTASNNVMIGIVDQGGKRVGHQKLGCNLNGVVSFLASFSVSPFIQCQIDTQNLEIGAQRSARPTNCGSSTNSRGEHEITVDAAPLDV